MLESRTDREGRFQFPDGVRLSLGCLTVGFRDRLLIHAPGYMPRSIYHDQYYRGPGFARLASEPVRLDRIRYARELQGLRDSIQYEAQLDALLGPSVWRESLESIASASVRVVGPPGVFVTEPGAAFDQVAVTGPIRGAFNHESAVLVTARDQRSGAAHAWMSRGDPVELGLPATVQWQLIGPSYYSGYPVFVHADTIHYPAKIWWSHRTLSANWVTVAAQARPVLAAAQDSGVIVTVEGGGNELGFYRVGRTQSSSTVVTPVAHRPIVDVLPRAQRPLECLAAGSDTPGVVVIARSDQARVLYRLNPQGQKIEWRTRLPVSVSPDETVTACAWIDQTLVIAQPNRGIRRFQLEEPFAKELEFWSGPRHTFTGLGIIRRDGPGFYVYALTAAPRSTDIPKPDSPTSG